MTPISSPIERNHERDKTVTKIDHSKISNISGNILKTLKREKNLRKIVERMGSSSKEKLKRNSYRRLDTSPCSILLPFLDLKIKRVLYPVRWK